MLQSFEFDTAIAAHRAWVKHLEFLVNGIELNTVNYGTAGDHHACSLGRWINGPGRAMAQCADFPALVATHIRFHQVAADIVQCLRHGENERAQVLVSAELAVLSTEIVRLLESLQQENRAA